MRPDLEILSQGEEVITGQTLDRNSAWLAGQSVDLGFRVRRQQTVGDDLADLTQILRDIATRSDVCIVTGGLGPTLDDLTREAVSQAFGLPLLHDPDAMRQIQAFYAIRNRTMPDINRKQALLPEGATRLDNHWGTAPGFYLQEQRCLFCFLPGVPSEMKNLFQQSVRPRLAETFTLNPGQLVTLRTIGIGESDLETRLAELVLPDNVSLGFRAGLDHVETKLWFPADYHAAERQHLAHQARDLIGDFVFTIDGLGQPSGSLIDVLDLELTARAWRCIFHETLSFGQMASKCAGRPWLLGSYCGIDPATLTATDAQIMIRQQLDLPLHQSLAADHAVNLTVELQTPTDTTQYHHRLTGSSTYKQNQAAMLSLNDLRQWLQQH
ncbi:MAG: molybdopterin-binding protein [Methylococcales bacterium]|nr:molybdopterin-binding protein [Methylococcales bacterium]